MQIEALITEISPDEACGPDLEYDADFMALDQAAQSKPEQQFGDTIVPAVEPNWADVRTRAEALMARTKDLRVVVLLTRAWLRQSEFPGLRDGLTLLQQLLARYWDQVHPRIEAEFDNDATMRLNALGALLDPNGFLRDLRAIHLIAPCAKGRVTVRDTLVVTGKLPATAENTLTLVQVQGLISEMAAEQAANINAARQSSQVLHDMQAQLNERLGTEHALGLQPLTDVIDTVVRTCDEVIGAGGTSVAAADGGVAVQQAVGSVPGEIRTREDAMRMLERVCEFMERTEPSNPAPLLIRRAQRLVSKNFIEIMEDLAPDSLGAIKSIAGIVERENVTS